MLTGGCSSRQPAKPLGQAYGEVFYAQTVNPQAPANREPVKHIPGEIGENIYSEIKDSKSFAEQLGDFIVGGSQRR